jgi:hypothetical protein
MEDEIANKNMPTTFGELRGYDVEIRCRRHGSASARARSATAATAAIAAATAVIAAAIPT